MIKVRKNDTREFRHIKSRAGVDPKDLNHAVILHETGTKFRYSLTLPDMKKLQFKNFKELKYHVNFSLNRTPLYFEIVKK